MKRWHRGALALTMLVSVAGCSILPERPPASMLHDFGPAAAGHQAPVRRSMVEVDAPGWLQDDRIHYRRLYADPTRVDAYARSLWVAPLPELLKERLSETGGGGHGYRLRLRLLDFEQVFDRRESAGVVMRFHAEVQGPDGRSVGARSFQLSRPTATPDAAGAVAAFAGLITEAIAQLRGWFAELPQSAVDGGLDAR